MSEKRLKVGVVGLGMGQGHVVNYKSIPEVHVEAICDVSQSWLDNRQKEWEVPCAYTDFNEMITANGLDAVSIATPTMLHAQMTIAALEAGKHVLVEKPMAVSTAEAEQMAAAAKANGRILMVSYNQRFGPDVQYLKRYIDEGHLGDIYFVRTLWRRPLGMLPPAVGERPTGTYARNWFNEAASGGGVAKDLGSHVLDIAMWLMGFPEVEDVCGRTYCKFLPDFLKNDGLDCDADDHSVGFVRFKNGATLQFEAAFGSYSESETIVTEIFGTKGGAYREAGKAPKIFSHAADAYTTIVPKLDEPQKNAQSEFVSAILSGKEPIVTPEQGIAVSRIIDGICGK